MQFAIKAAEPTVLGVTQSALGQRWQLRNTDERLVLAMQQQAGIPDILARIAAGRGITLDSLNAYLNPSLRELLPDPAHLKDMDKAIARLVSAVVQNEIIGIFGDYDVDGATSSALLSRYFTAISIKSEIYIPDRQQEGYGPNIGGFRALKEKGCRLIITVDCGAVAYEPLKQAAEEGMEIIVLDHHAGAAELPKAVAIVNPNRLDETSPCGHLAAVGVCFLTLVALNRALREAGFFTSPTGRGRNAESVSGEGTPVPKTPHPNPLPEGEGIGGQQADSALSAVSLRAEEPGAGNIRDAEQGRNIKEPDLLQYLDLVALGTVCDVVPLRGINRAFVTQGLKILQRRTNVGLKTLCVQARIEAALAPYHLGFILGPRINAGGRVGRAMLGSQLLLHEDETELEQMAEELGRYNEERKAIEEMVQEEAILLAERQANRAIIMVGKEGWHQGVIGIVAGRLKERFERPAAVFSLENGVAKASARSVSGVDFGAAVIAARESGLLLAGGGHAMAAGFSVAAARLDELHAFLESRLEQSVADYFRDRHLSVDAVISPQGATLELAQQLELAAPYGAGNASPRLVIASAKIVEAKWTADKHLMLWVIDSGGKGRRLRATAFRSKGTPLGNFLLSAGNRPIHLAGSLKKDFWQGEERVSFNIDDAAFAA